MNYDDVLRGPSKEQQILDRIDELKDERPYNYAPCNEAWIKALEAVEMYIETGL